MKIKDHPIRMTEMSDNDVFLIDGDSGTQIIPSKNLAITDSEIDSIFRETDQKK